MWASVTKAPRHVPFHPDLYRNFGIGFGAGALAILLVNGTDLIEAVPQLVASIF